ncbi:hypothetical protein ACFSTC_22020 [Nonomuraea ferruginea]
MRWSGRDLATQRRDIEALIVRTLLLAERTPTLRRYGLVRLALLHRHCGRLPGNWFGEFDGVSRSELRMVFTTAGGSAEIADKVDKRMAERIAHTKAVEAGRVGDRAAPARQDQDCSGAAGGDRAGTGPARPAGAGRVSVGARAPSAPVRRPACGAGTPVAQGTRQVSPESNRRVRSPRPFCATASSSWLVIRVS